MVVNIMLTLTLLGLSGWQTTTAGGDLESAGGFNPWQSKVCQSAPFVYMRPFMFTYKDKLGAHATSIYCGWPDVNSNLRLCITVFGFVTVCMLFSKFLYGKFLGRVARTLLLFFTGIHFASFVLDCNASIVGGASCDGKFTGTALGTYFSTSGATLTCNAVNYPGLCFLDFLQVVLYYLLFECWGMCKDLYNVKAEEEDDDDDEGDDEDDAAPRKRKGGKRKGGKAQSTKNPLQSTDEYADPDEDEEDQGAATVSIIYSKTDVDR